MAAETSETKAATPLGKSTPRTVPYYGIANEGSLDLGDEYEDGYEDEEDFDLAEALEQLEAVVDHGKSCATAIWRTSLNDPRFRTFCDPFMQPLCLMPRPRSPSPLVSATLFCNACPSHSRHRRLEPLYPDDLRHVAMWDAKSVGRASNGSQYDQFDQGELQEFDETTSSRATNLQCISSSLHYHSGPLLPPLCSSTLSNMTVPDSLAKHPPKPLPHPIRPYSRPSRAYRARDALDSPDPPCSSTARFYLSTNKPLRKNCINMSYWMYPSPITSLGQPDDPRTSCLGLPLALPYEVETLDEMDDRLERICCKLAECIKAREWQMGFRTWDNALNL